VAGDGEDRVRVTRVAAVDDRHMGVASGNVARETQESLLGVGAVEDRLQPGAHGREQPINGHPARPCQREETIEVSSVDRVATPVRGRVLQDRRNGYVLESRVLREEHRAPVDPLVAAERPTRPLHRAEPARKRRKHCGANVVSSANRGKRAGEDQPREKDGVP
jgi:hypothetical protein